MTTDKIRDIYFDGNVIVRSSTVEDAVFVANRLRAMEARELWSAYRRKPKEVCVHAVLKSEIALTVEVKGEAVLLFGVRTVSLLENKGFMWMLTTEGIREIAVAMQKYTRQYVDMMLERWAVLENHVLKDNKLALTWLRRAGFRLYDAQPYGFDNELFVKVQKGRENICVEQHSPSCKWPDRSFPALQARNRQTLRRRPIARRKRRQRPTRKIR